MKNWTLSPVAQNARTIDVQSAMKTFLEASVPLHDAAWSHTIWGEVELFLERRCSRDELIWLADTAGVRVPLMVGPELTKPEVLTRLGDLPPRVLADRYVALLARRRDDGPRRFSTAA